MFLLSSRVSLLSKALVSEKLRVNTFQTHVTFLLWLLDTVSVGLVTKVTTSVSLHFNHGEKITELTASENNVRYNVSRLLLGYTKMKAKTGA